MNDVNLSEKELDQLSKKTLIEMIIGLQTSVNELMRTVRILNEQLEIRNQRSYGRKTEQVSALQMELDLGLNEPEAQADPDLAEPTLEEAAPKRKRPSGKRAEDIGKITNHREEFIGLSEEKLEELFGKDNWKRLPDQIITKLEHIPASFEAVTYKIGVYASKNGDRFIRADKPVELWQNSIATPTLVSSMIVAKYINAVPLYRQEAAYAQNDVNISRTTMANWMIMASDRYLRYYYEGIKKRLLKEKYIHADETPVEVSKDGRKTGALSYMWVYTTLKQEGIPKLVLYDYQKTRSHDHPREFLRGFSGTVMCDGYQAYHALEKEDPESFTVAGCWVHAKRKYTEIVKTDGSKKSKGTLSEKAVKKISHIFYENGKLDSLPVEERLKGRQEKIKPLVDDYFEWVRKNSRYVDPQSQTGKAFAYSLNQEKYLRTFLNDAMVEMDNNAAERAIRPFTTGRKNWVMIDTIRGAEASAVLYSLAEISRANNLKAYEYFSYLLTELPKYIHDFETEVPDSLYPWSEEFPKELYRK